MKYISLILLVVGFSAKATTNYNCDDTDLITGQMTTSHHTTVEVTEDGKTAQIFVQGVFPGAKKEPSFKLQLSSGSFYIKTFSTSQLLQDLTVTFRLTQMGKAGILKEVGMPQFGGGSNLSMIICELE